MLQQAERLFEFGPYRLDPAQQVLMRGTEKVPLTPKAFQTLLVLVENRGKVVAKEELLNKVWPETFVEEATLAQNVFTLRRQLQDDRAEAQYIETVPKRGYRFVATVKVEESAAQVRVSVPAAVLSTQRERRMRLWPVAAGLVAVLAAGGFFAWRHFAGAVGHRPMLAVLPVQNLSGDAARDYIADGLTEELISELGSVGSGQMGVIARTSSMAYKGTSKTVAQIGQELGVDYVLECSFRDRPGAIRFTAQLIQVRDQTHLWAEDFDESLNDVVTMEDRIAMATMEQTRLKLTEAAQNRLVTARPIDAAAHDLYLKGRAEQATRSPDGLQSSVEDFQGAVQRDPRYAAAWAGLADSLNLQNFYGLSPGAGTVLNAQTAATKAIELDDSLADGHAAMAYVNFMWLWDWPKAGQEFRRAIQLNPNYVPAHHWYALYLTAMGRKEEAVKEIQVAQSLDPLSRIVATAAGYVAFFNRDYDAAIRMSTAVLNRDPNFVVARFVLARAYDARGMYGQAIAELEPVVQSGRAELPYLAVLGHAYAKAGRQRDVRKVLDRLSDAARQGRFVGQTAQAMIYMGLDDKENAIRSLRRSRDQNDANRIWMRVDPVYDELRSDEGFQELLRFQGASWQ